MKLSNRIIAAVLLIAGSSGAVYAFSKHNDWGLSAEEKAEFVTERVTRKLDLDGQQQQYFAELARSVVQIMQDVRITRTQNVTEIETLLQEPSFNQSRVLELVQEKTRVINEKAPLVVASLAIFLDSLSVEQKQQMQEFLKHRHQHHQSGDND